MLDKILSVSPSQKGATQDSKKPESKSESKTGNDFENILQSNLKNQTRKNDKKRSDNGDKEDLKALKKEKSSDKTTEKSSRGNKKRMIEDDDSPSENVLMISNVMASPESEFEIPENEENLAKINLDAGEVDKKIEPSHTEQSKTDLGSPIADDPGSLKSKLESLLDVAVDSQLLDSNQFSRQISDGDQELAEQLLAEKLSLEGQVVSASDSLKYQIPTNEVQNAESANLLDENSLQASEAAIEPEELVPTKDQDLGIVPSLDRMSAPKETIPEDAVNLATEAKETSVEAADAEETVGTGELVSEDPEFKKLVEQTGILSEMKSFEEAKGLKGDKAKSFEEKVLSQLRQEYHDLTAKVSGSKQSENFSNLSQEKSETFEKSFSDSKPEPMKSDSLLHIGQSNTDFRTQFAPKVGSITEASTLNQLETHHDKNIQEVMSKAQYLVKQGGGEMNVKMSPDGIGEVQLKVMLDGGKINIEMQTSDKSIKKMIEDSLSELKSGLAAQQLSVEHVKINTVTATNTEQQTSLQTNLGQSWAQSDSREFWKQFQENFGNNSRKSSYNEVTNVSTNRVKEPTPLTAAQRAYGSNGRTGSTLNQVA